MSIRGSLLAALSAVFLTVMNLSAETTKISPTGLTLLREYRNNPVSRNGQAPAVIATIGINGGASKTIAEIEAAGGKVLTDLGNIVVVSMPITAVEGVAEMSNVREVAFGEVARPMLNFARTDTEVPSVVAGVLTDMYGNAIPPLRGQGVVAGVFDTGFDFTNPSFTDASGNLRIKEYIAIAPSGKGDNTLGSGYIDPEFIKDYTISVTSDPERIRALVTDDPNATHGTHVAGIMAGSYSGSVTARDVPDQTDTSPGRARKYSRNPFYGVATQSDIVMGAGDLNLGALIVGMSEMVRYAKAEGKPAVINLSLGTVAGLRTGRDVYSEAFAKLGEEAVIVMAAGNEGDLPIGLYTRTTPGNSKVKTFIEIPADATPNKQEYAFFTTADGRDIKARLVVYDIRADKEIAGIDLNYNESGFADNNLASQLKLTANKEFNNTYSGAIMGHQATEYGSGQKYVVLVTNDLKVKNKNTDFRIGIILTVPSDTEVFGYGDENLYFASNGLNGWLSGSGDGSISGMACGPNVLVVGSYNSRKYFAGYEDREWGMTNMTLGAISDFSSYGRMQYGGSRPQLLAPGNTLISAINSAYSDNNPDQVEDASAFLKAENGRNYYWRWMSGTSMATPMVSGIIALMLQADPTLKVAEITEILEKTAEKDSFTELNPLQSGAGKINAASAIKEVYARKNAGIEGIVTDGLAEILIEGDGSTFSVFAAGAKGLRVSLTDMAGAVVAQTESKDDKANVGTGNLRKGVYVLAVSTADGRQKSEKVIVK